jgi:cytochrome c2
MLRFPKIALALVAAIAMPLHAETLGLGRAATPEEVAAWDIDVRPDGLGLPEGSGDALTGEEVFTKKCASCHGDFAEGVGRWPVLAGGQGTLASQNPVKTVGSYWPYLSTAWDYVHRAMPFGEAQSLSDDEVYAIVAYILYSNNLEDDDFTLSRDNFLDVEMPNADGFFPDDRTKSPLWGPREVCMKNCKPQVEITRRAAVLDVTPESEDDDTSEAADTEETLVVAAAEPAIDEALAKKGEKVFKKCKACHQVGDGAKNKVGPMLTGVVGSPIGAIEGFKYSNALKALAEDDAVWDIDALHGFLTKPRKWAKGTKMSFGGLRKEEDRLAVIEYLKAASN